jgi:3-hydroxyisobutyrate dehydrogenase
MQAIGFIGVGGMGQPMALNLRKAGPPLIVWSRTESHGDPVRDAGASVAADVATVFSHARSVVMMLFDERATDTVLPRATPAFDALVRDRTIVSMSSVAPEYSGQLARDVIRFMLTSAVGLAEAFHFGQRNGLPLEKTSG